MCCPIYSCFFCKFHYQGRESHGLCWYTAQTLAGLQIFFKTGGPKWPMEQKMVGHFLKWWAHCWLYRKTCLKLPLKKEDQLLLNAGQKYCRMLQESILQYFWALLSYHLLLRSLFCLFFSGCLRQVLLYGDIHVLSVLLNSWNLWTRCKMNIFIKVRFFTTKKDGSTGPTALESDEPYFEIMGQWLGPTINLKACSGFLSMSEKTFFLLFWYM